MVSPPRFLKFGCLPSQEDNRTFQMSALLVKTEIPVPEQEFPANRLEPDLLEPWAAGSVRAIRTELHYVLSLL